MDFIRKHQFLDEHVIYAPSRSNRPFQEGGCPFCTGSEEVPFEFTGIDFLPNKYPSLKMNDRNRGEGICEVILYSSDHDRKLADFDEQFLVTLISAWKKRTQQIIRETNLKHTFLFENHGEGIGVSLPHPHGQFYAFPFVPDIIIRKQKMGRNQCTYCDQDPRYIVYENTHSRVIVPSFMRWPFELHLITERHLTNLIELQDEEIDDLAQSLNFMLNTVQIRAGRETPYILSVYQDVTPNSDLHLHIELISPQINEKRVKFRGGVETALGIFINAVFPEDLVAEINEKKREIEDIVTVFSPGRINIIGEHTDHQGGLVLPASIQLGITIHAKKNEVLSIFSEEHGEAIIINQVEPDELWKKYIFHTIKGFEEKIGHPIKASFYFSSNLPIGAGLSSSAALIVGLLKVMMVVFDFDIDDWELIKLAQNIEHYRIGVKSGILDFAAVVLGTKGNAILLDCSELNFTEIDISSVQFLVVETGKHRELMHTEYNQRIETLSQIKNKIKDMGLNIESKSDLESIDISGVKLLQHVLSENERVTSYAELIGDDSHSAGSLLYKSHASLRDDFDVSWKEADLLVEHCKQTGVEGARMVGAGWGGAIIIQTTPEQMKGVTHSIHKFSLENNISIRIIPVVASKGVHQRDTLPHGKAISYLLDQSKSNNV